MVEGILLNATDSPSIEETESEDTGDNMQGTWVAQILKTLDVVVLSWLSCLCSITWKSGTVPMDWHTGVAAPLETVFQIQRDHTCQNLYARILERRVRLLVEPQV